MPPNARSDVLMSIWRQVINRDYNMFEGILDYFCHMEPFHAESHYVSGLVYPGLSFVSFGVVDVFF